MAFFGNKETQEINQYFKKFVSANKSSSYFNEPDTIIMKNIVQLDEIPFDSAWNYLMKLVQLIERRYCNEGFDSDRNYIRFELGNREFIQDKGPTKMEAIYSCCVLTLKKYLKEE